LSSRVAVDVGEVSAQVRRVRDMFSLWDH